MKADRQAVSRLLKQAQGQIDGILKMIEEDRYCIDVSNQLMSVEGLIKKANKLVLQEHLRHCVKNVKDEDDLNQKMDEMIHILNRL